MAVTGACRARPVSFVLGVAIIAAMCALHQGVDAITLRRGAAGGSGCGKPAACAVGKCGVVKDKCGRPWQCGGCAGTDKCVATTCTCTPRTTCDAELQCGTQPDGCGGHIQCGKCKFSGSQCVDHMCKCTPKTCTDMGFTCNAMDDGCGGMPSCGTCKTPDEMCHSEKHHCMKLKVDPVTTPPPAFSPAQSAPAPAPAPLPVAVAANITKGIKLSNLTSDIAVSAAKAAMDDAEKVAAVVAKAAAKTAVDESVKMVAQAARASVAPLGTGIGNAAAKEAAKESEVLLGKEEVGAYEAAKAMALKAAVAKIRPAVEAALARAKPLSDMAGAELERNLTLRARARAMRSVDIAIDLVVNASVSTMNVEGVAAARKAATASALRVATDTAARVASSYASSEVVRELGLKVTAAAQRAAQQAATTAAGHVIGRHLQREAQKEVKTGVEQALDGALRDVLAR